MINFIRRIAFTVLLIVLAAPQATMAAGDQIIQEVKGKNVTFFDKSGSEIRKFKNSSEVKEKLIGLSVEYVKATGYYRARIDGSVVYLTSKDIKVDHGVGRNSTQICADVKNTSVRKGSSGSGISCD